MQDLLPSKKKKNSSIGQWNILSISINNVKFLIKVQKYNEYKICLKILYAFLMLYINY